MTSHMPQAATILWHSVDGCCITSNVNVNITNNNNNVERSPSFDMAISRKACVCLLVCLSVDHLPYPASSSSSSSQCSNRWRDYVIHRSLPLIIIVSFFLFLFFRFFIFATTAEGKITGDCLPACYNERFDRYGLDTSTPRLSADLD